MGWGSIRREKWNAEKGVCEYCHKPIKSMRQSCLHHKINRCQGGKSTFGNAELRHTHCEHEAHNRFKYGNKDGNLKPRRERCQSKSPSVEQRLERIERLLFPTTGVPYGNN